MIAETVFTNALMVTRDAVIAGSLRVADGAIAELGGSAARGEDFEGDYLIAGLVELHTDHLEGHYAPRPGLRWNPLAAVQAHDAQVAASGISTVFDALRVGMDDDSELRASDMLKLAEAIRLGQGEGRLRAEHFIHLRCEVSAPDCLDALSEFAEEPLARLASMMDHSPGQRQFATVAACRKYYQKTGRMSDAEFDAFVVRRTANSERYAGPFRDAISDWARERGIALASHDDATAAHVEEAQSHGVRVAEFPTTLDAAEASRSAGLAVLMGAPNVVRGGSHSGNISARELAERGLLGILSSDYVPSSLLHAVFDLAHHVPAMSLPEALALVTLRPASVLGLTDRGEIAAGKRADLVRVRVAGGVPVVRGVWRGGRR